MFLLLRPCPAVLVADRVVTPLVDFSQGSVPGADGLLHPPLAFYSGDAFEFGQARHYQIRGHLGYQHFFSV